MELKRKPFQGVMNIIRFNWHFYVIAGLILLAVIFFNHSLPEQIQVVAFWMALLAGLSIIISLLTSFYIYDRSDLYQLQWLPSPGNKRILTINAGFDETTEIIKGKFPNCNITACDFYDPSRHTEVSLQRARKAYPSPLNTIQINTDRLPFADNSFDYTLTIFSAHEIRAEQERIDFFNELHRVTSVSGEIFVTEHLRDWNNFFAYTLGFFHFHSRKSWMRTFSQANLKLIREIKSTPYITTFILTKNGNTL